MNKGGRKKDERTPPGAAELRLRAEERLAQRGGSVPMDSIADAKRLVHELQVHQIELEMQNEELKRERAELEAERRRYTELYDFAPVGYLTLGRDGSIRKANLAAARMLGLERSRLAGMRFGQFLQDDSRSGFDALLENAFQSKGKQACSEVSIRSAGGEPRWAKVVALADGEDECRVALTDITERKRLEQQQALVAEELRATKDRLQRIITASPVVMYALDLDFSPNWVSENVEKITGYTVAECMEPEWWANGLHPDDREAALTAMSRVLESGYHVHEYRFRFKDGSHHWIHDQLYVVRDARGKPAEIFGVWNDVTDRRHAEEQLQESLRELEESRRNFSAIVERSHDGILVLDRDGVVLYCNESAKKLFDRPDLTGSVLGIPLVSGEMTEVDIVRLSGGPGEAELRCQETTWNERPALLAVLTDVTERNASQREREALRAQLAQADRMSTMGTLAAGVAHEINNPLSYVLYNIESLNEDLPRLTTAMRRCYNILCEQLGPDTVEEMLGAESSAFFKQETIEDIHSRFRDALAGVVRIKDIARGLGTFSRVEQAEVGPVDVRLPIEHACNMAFNEIKHRARLVKDLARVPMVLATEGKLAQVFLNLLINAAHAIREGHVDENEIRVRTWVDGDDVFIEVSDTGKGIAPEHIDKVFEPFFTTKPRGVGTGLGLSICKKIANDFGGDIYLESELGKGTRFTVRLPRIPDDYRAGDSVAPRQEEAPPAARGRILVIDDEAGIRNSIARMLKREHEVVTVGSGVEAKALLENDRRFDVIFCDLMMPQMSGMELHAWLSGVDPELAAQVVFITGGAFTPGAVAYLEKAGNLRVEKPFDTATFKKLTAELVLAAQRKRSGGG